MSKRIICHFFFSSRRRHTRWNCAWSSDVCSSDLFVEPTIFDHVRNDMKIAQEEIFGPVLSVIRFKTEAEAVALANDSSYGLQASVWSQHLDRAHRVARDLRAGTVHVNQ